MDRHLAAILAADMVGYSRLIEQDESGTIDRLNSDRRAIIDPAIERHDGAIVRLAGDGSLVEFPSVVKAVQCAIDIQRGMSKRNAGRPADRQLVFRMGISLGDIVVDGDNLHGEGINIAARLESLAPPGGIFVSEEVARQVDGKVDASVEFLEERAVKNIQRSVRIHRVVHTGSSLGATGAPAKRMGKRGRRVAVAAVCLVGVVLIVTTIAWQSRTDETPSVSIDGNPLSTPDMPSLAVLPFDSLGTNPGQTYFADGFAEDVTTDLAKISGLFVVARNSAFRYRESDLRLEQVAGELGVRYILEGSVRRFADRIQINAQLIDARTGGHVWADRYDGSLTDVFALQEQVTQRIVEALSINLTAEDQQRRGNRETNDLEAYDAFLQGWNYFLVQDRDSIAKARTYFIRAIALDPSYGRAHAALARVYALAWSRGWDVDLQWDDTLCEEERHLRLALQAPTALAYLTLAHKRLAEQHYDEAIEEIERALKFNPGDVEALFVKSWILIVAGNPEVGLRTIERAMRLDPGDLARKKWMAGVALMTLDAFDEAAASFASARELNPGLSPMPQLAVLTSLGERALAEQILMDYMKLRGWSDATNIQDALRAFENSPVKNLGNFLGFIPYRRPEDVERIGRLLAEFGFCCADQVDDYVERLRQSGHSRSAAMQRHIDSLRDHGLEGCVSS